MSYKTLLLSEDNGVATLTLNRPDKRNAISFELVSDVIRSALPFNAQGHGITAAEAKGGKSGSGVTILHRIQ